jgi:hypothetical protein
MHIASTMSSLSCPRLSEHGFYPLSQPKRRIPSLQNSTPSCGKQIGLRFEILGLNNEAAEAFEKAASLEPRSTSLATSLARAQR